MLFKFEKACSSLCSFCKTIEDTSLHSVFECNITNQLWDQIRLPFEDEFNFKPLTPQDTNSGLSDLIDSFYLMNHLLLIFKFNV